MQWRSSDTNLLEAQFTQVAMSIKSFQGNEYLRESDISFVKSVN